MIDWASWLHPGTVLTVESHLEDYYEATPARVLGCENDLELMVIIAG
jgi:hypothetical protein